jgi:hypothetical protein
MKLNILTSVTMKSTIFWDVTPCSLVEIYRRFLLVSWLRDLLFEPENWNSNFLPSFSKLLTRLRRQILEDSTLPH